MDFRLTDEQILLGETVRDIVAREPSGRLWPALVEFGVLEGELGMLELALVAQELGASLASVPFVDSAAAGLVVDVSPGASAACCLSEVGRRFTPSDPAARYDGARLSGEKCGVSFAAHVDVLAVPAAGPDGLVVALVPPAAAELEAEESLDPTLEQATVRFDRVEVTAGAAVADVPRLAAVAGVLAAADAVGAATTALALACDYAAQRRQFGHTIGSFQAIRHLLADMHVKVESSRSSVLYASAALHERTPDSMRTASIAKAYAARATHEVAHGALQVLGGIAFTQEHPMHRYLRRIAVRGGQFGTAREHEVELGHSLAHALEVAA
jgi:alkylation response protein AidB-like acyl-CoA dehydrogenase